MEDIKELCCVEGCDKPKSKYRLRAFTSVYNVKADMQNVDPDRLYLCEAHYRRANRGKVQAAASSPSLAATQSPSASALPTHMGIAAPFMGDAPQATTGHVATTMSNNNNDLAMGGSPTQFTPPLPYVVLELKKWDLPQKQVYYLFSKPSFVASQAKSTKKRKNAAINPSPSPSPTPSPTPGAVATTKSDEEPQCLLLGNHEAFSCTLAKFMDILHRELDNKLQQRILTDFILNIPSLGLRFYQDSVFTQQISLAQLYEIYRVLGPIINNAPSSSMSSLMTSPNPDPLAQSRVMPPFTIECVCQDVNFLLSYNMLVRRYAMALNENNANDQKVKKLKFDGEEAQQPQGADVPHHHNKEGEDDSQSHQQLFQQQMYDLYSSLDQHSQHPGATVDASKQHQGGEMIQHLTGNDDHVDPIVALAQQQQQQQGTTQQPQQQQH